MDKYKPTKAFFHVGMKDNSKSSHFDVTTSNEMIALFYPRSPLRGDHLDVVIKDWLGRTATSIKSNELDFIDPFYSSSPPSPAPCPHCCCF